MTKEEKLQKKKAKARKEMLEAVSKEDEVKAQLELFDTEIELDDLKKKEQKEKEEKLLNEQMRLQQEISQLKSAQKSESSQERPSLVKDFFKIVSFPAYALGKLFGENEFIASFLDKSKIKEKDNYAKQTAKSFEQISKTMKKIQKEVDQIGRGL